MAKETYSYGKRDLLILAYLSMAVTESGVVAAELRELSARPLCLLLYTRLTRQLAQILSHAMPTTPTMPLYWYIG